MSAAATLMGSCVVLRHQRQAARRRESRTHCPLNALRLGRAGWGNPIEDLLCHTEQLVDLARLAAEHATPGRSKAAATRSHKCCTLACRSTSRLLQVRWPPSRQQVELGNKRSINQRLQRVLITADRIDDTRQPRQSVTSCWTDGVCGNRLDELVRTTQRCRGS